MSWAPSVGRGSWVVGRVRLAKDRRCGDKNRAERHHRSSSALRGQEDGGHRRRKVWSIVQRIPKLLKFLFRVEYGSDDVGQRNGMMLYALPRQLRGWRCETANLRQFFCFYGPQMAIDREHAGIYTVSVIFKDGGKLTTVFLTKILNSLSN
jgi:hypothetical protein